MSILNKKKEREAAKSWK